MEAWWVQGEFFISRRDAETQRDILGLRLRACQYQAIVQHLGSGAKPQLIKSLSAISASLREITTISATRDSRAPTLNSQTILRLHDDVLHLGRCGLERFAHPVAAAHDERVRAGLRRLCEHAVDGLAVAPLHRRRGGDVARLGRVARCRDRSFFHDHIYRATPGCGFRHPPRRVHEGASCAHSASPSCGRTRLLSDPCLMPFVEGSGEIPETTKDIGVDFGVAAKSM